MACSDIKISRLHNQSNGLCVDLEAWHDAELVKTQLKRNKDLDQIMEAIGPVLELLHKYNTRATFAVLGWVAEKYPLLIKQIHEQGHEIACHGYSHRMLEHMTPEEFEDEILRSVQLIFSITGEKPLGFRAPNFSLNNSTRWAVPILIRHGFRYDASIFPTKTGLYGVNGAPLTPYRISPMDVRAEDPQGKMVEFPNTVFNLGYRIPVGGGFYLRFFPLFLLRLVFNRIKRKRPILLYFHPWELYTNTPRISTLPFMSRFVTYFGARCALKKVECLLRNFKFKPLVEKLKEDGFF